MLWSLRGYACLYSTFFEMSHVSGIFWHSTMSHSLHILMVRISFDKISLLLFSFWNLSISMILICLLLECSEWNLCYFHECYFSSYCSFKIGIFKMHLLCWIHESYVLKIVELDTSYTDINHNICPYSCK